MRNLRMDWWLFLLLCLIAIFSLFTLYSATNGNWSLVHIKSLHWLAGFALLFAIAQIDYKHIRKWIPSLFMLSLGLLMVVIFYGIIGKGAQRWIDLGPINLQPSELAKLTVIMMLAWWFSRVSNPPNPLHWLVGLVIILIPSYMVVKQPDLGTALLIMLSGFVVLFMAGLKWKWIGIGLLAIAISAPFLWDHLHPYQQQRILTFLDPESDPLGSGYHIIQSMTAIGSGGFWGKGWMNGTQTQLNFLPEQHTDFIFGVIAEEQGLVGILLMLSLYLLISLRSLYISLTAQEAFGRLLGAGLSFYFIFALLTNIAMVTGLTPVVGIPLPLISYGGSSLMSFMFSFALLVIIQNQKKYTHLEHT